MDFAKIILDVQNLLLEILFPARLFGRQELAWDGVSIEGRGVPPLSIFPPVIVMGEDWPRAKVKAEWRAH